MPKPKPKLATRHTRVQQEPVTELEGKEIQIAKLTKENAALKVEIGKMREICYPHAKGK